MRLMLLILILTMCEVVQAGTYQTARGLITVNNGDVVCPPDVDAPDCTVKARFTMWEGQIDNLHDATFIGCNFSRKAPHTEVFTNCSNLTFVDCNLNNVELPADFTTKGSLTIHQERVKRGNKNYHVVERGDNKTEEREIIEETVDLVTEEYPYLMLNAGALDTIRSKWQLDGTPTTEIRERLGNPSISNTAPQKQFKHNKVSPNETSYDKYRSERLKKGL